MTATGRPSSAAASTVAATAAAPAMSHFIVTMPVAGLMFRPPESKVMPLPTSATEAFGAAGAYDMVTMRGGFTEPWPTPTMPPKPPLTRALSSSTDTVTLAGEAATRFLTVVGEGLREEHVRRGVDQVAGPVAGRTEHGGARDGILGGLALAGARDDHDARAGAVARPPWPTARRPAPRRRPERGGLVVGVAPGVARRRRRPTGSRASGVGRATATVRLPRTLRRAAPAAARSAACG